MLGRGAAVMDMKGRVFWDAEGTLSHVPPETPAGSPSASGVPELTGPGVEDYIAAVKDRLRGLSDDTSRKPQAVL